MLNRDDLVDIVLERLSLGASSVPMPPPAAVGRLSRQSKGRLFLSEYDIKKKLAYNPQRLTIPQDAILSPLAMDWLALRRVTIVRE